MENRTYVIPLNYKDAGSAINGLAAKRNVFEGVGFALIGWFIVRLLPITGDFKITVYVFVMGLFFMIGMTGIGGDPISVFIVDGLNWFKRRKPFIYHNHGEMFSSSAGDLMLSQPQLIDAIADAVDKVRDNLASKQPDYIEGVTFQFAQDPELQALRNADERKRKVKANAEANKEVPSQEDAAASEPKAKPEINVAQIMANIVLQDDDEVE